MKKSILEYWKDSCQLFNKDQGKLFTLVTLNTVIKNFHAESGLVSVIAVLFMCIMLTVNIGASGPLWERVFAFFSIKSLIGVKLLGITKAEGAGFFGAFFTFTIALAASIRPTLHRKDSSALFLSLFYYLPFFVIGQEIVLIVPYFAFLYMDMKNHPTSFFKAIYGTGLLVLCHFPVVAFFTFCHSIMLYVGYYLTVGMRLAGVPAIIGQALVPMAWFIITYSLFFSACAMYYTKVKHADRELLFGKQ